MDVLICFLRREQNCQIKFNVELFKIDIKVITVYSETVYSAKTANELHFKTPIEVNFHSLALTFKKMFHI